MSPVDQIPVSAPALTPPPLTPAAPEPSPSAQHSAAGEPDPVSAPALTPADPVAELLAERYAPEPDDVAHGTDDKAVRRALDAAARTRRW